MMPPTPVTVQRTLLYAGAAALGALAVRSARLVRDARRAGRVARAVSAFQRPTGDRPRVMIFGDSLAVGVGAGRPEHSVAGLLARAYPRASILNYACAGARAVDVLQQLRQADAGGAALVWISVGGNDVLRGTSLEELREIMQTLLREAHRRGAYVVLTLAANLGRAPLFFWPLGALLSARVRRVRALFRALSAAHGVEFVDFYREAEADFFSRAPDVWYAEDGVHPSSIGYAYCFRTLMRSRAFRSAFRAAGPARRGTPVADAWRSATMEHTTMANEERKISGDRIEGEGSYSGAKQYNEATKKFVDQGKVEQAAKEAQPKSPDEARQMREAEKIGKGHAKGEDPALNRGGTPEDSGGS